jgi:transcription-repair coupling factor (superfamily II helicase)
MIARVFGNQFAEMVNNPDFAGLENISPELAPLYAAGIKSVSGRDLVWITGENENTAILKNDLDAWNKFLGDRETEVHLHCLPWEDPYINNHIAPETAGEKTRLLDDLKENKPLAVITTLAGLNIPLEKKKDKELLARKLSVNDPLAPNELIKILSLLGYQAGKRVEKAGDYSIHGKILDLFPAGFTYPYRIKFSDTGIASIKRFHPVSQISIEAVESLKITTTVYFETTKSKNTEIRFLTELLEDYVIIATDYDLLRDEYKKLLENFDHMRKHQGEETAWPRVADIFTYPVETLKVINLSSREGNSDSPRVKPDFRTFLNMSAESVCELAEEGNKIVFCGGNREKEQAILEKFHPAEILGQDIPLSLYFPHSKEYFISYLGRESSDAWGNLRQGTRHLFEDIEPGDFVVHKTHGIGRFTGFKHLEINGEEAEFLAIVYRDDAKIYVPVHELDVLSKYIGFQGQEPALDKIGGSSWEAKKKEAKKNIKAFAQELLDLYARRKAISGYSFKKNTEVEKAFKKNFSYVETRDQKAAIKDVLTDLAAPYPMDRLICGDVSFGKTEIALRAAIRVVAAKKQVALLCPTTVLAYQHYTTFKNRFAPFPYTIELLSRNVPLPRRKEILPGLAAGEIDIIIGTHALLGSAVEFKNPGLFIIDEEQRFGVFQKEKLKQGREHIDVLSLSATPIPRTLSFTAAGLQDISHIDTAPVGRKAVKNYFGPYSEELMMSALRKETDRQGQAFIIYNHIESIYTFKDKLQDLLPGIVFALIHARMAAGEIEDTVLQFLNKEVDVLISTTIIENGMDLPGVNTLIIIDAHLFGLTQLYQLRGRIGRGTRQAYTYFFHGDLQAGNRQGPGGLPEKADKRLEALREFSQLGSGYKVAEFDLKMRGAGSLLGSKQHGHIEALGYDYFLGLLKKTISELKGEETIDQDTLFTLRFSYSISENYIPDPQERIAVYKRILNAETVGELLECKAELEDRYGEMEDSLLKGFFAQGTKILAHFFRFEEVEVSPDMMIITLRPVYDQKKATLAEFIDLFNARVTDANVLIVEYADFREFMETLILFLLENES